MRAIMFDLDGTLLDTLEDLGDAANQALADLGFAPHPYPFYRHAVGDGAAMLSQRSLPQAQRDEATIARGLGRLAIRYEEHWDAKTAPYAGVMELLAKLQQRSLLLAVLSNKPEAALHRCVTRFFPAHSFTAFRGVRPHGPIKPDPTAAIEMAAELGIAANQWLYVGDTDTDMQTAVAAGMVAIGCTWGFRDRAELLEHGAAFIIDKPDELLALLGD